ncbi:MAG: hypothetical protein VKK80_14830 [Prochlorothrix sp.]|nr:hypothetical protein [Prochlorothrix sp.]
MMLNNLTEQIADRLLDIFEKVIDDRRQYFLYNPAKIPFRSSVTEIIEVYSTKMHCSSVP